MENYTSEDRFSLWINQWPESFHPLDMERFYRFVKAVCESGNFQDSSWLESKIRATKHSMSDDQIRRFCELFIDLQDFYRA